MQHFSLFFGWKTSTPASQTSIFLWSTSWEFNCPVNCQQNFQGIDQPWETPGETACNSSFHSQWGGQSRSSLKKINFWLDEIHWAEYSHIQEVEALSILSGIWHSTGTILLRTGIFFRHYVGTTTKMFSIWKCVFSDNLNIYSYSAPLYSSSILSRSSIHFRSARFKWWHNIRNTGERNMKLVK